MDLDKMDRKEHFRTSLPDEKESSNQDKRIETEHEDNLNLEDEKKELQKDNVEKIDESQVSIENERFDEETINNAGGMNTVKYRTKEVAIFLEFPSKLSAIMLRSLNLILILKKLNLVIDVMVEIQLIN